MNHAPAPLIHVSSGLWIALACLIACPGAHAAETNRSRDSHAPAVDPARVEAIASMLSDGVFAFGPRVTDRAAWEELGRRPQLGAAVAKAEALASKPLVPLEDDLFLEYSRTGNRTDYEKAYFDRTGRLTPLVVAECIEHRGRFLPAIEALVEAFAGQKTWMLPAHDAGLKNFRGESTDIDLFSSALACDLTHASYLLGDALGPETRRRIDENVRRRVLDPFRDMATGKRKPTGWITATSNWNAVCLANVLGAALASLPDKQDRAVFAAAAEQDSTHYLSGFAADGYCVEGLGYWNYGFGNYVRLCELLDRVTGGKVDCFDRDKVRAIASFPARLRIVDGVYPAYGDAHLDVEPWPPLVDFVARRFDLPAASEAAKREAAGVLSTSLGGSLGETLMFTCPNSATTRPAPPPAAPALHDWFPDAQVLTCRPGAGPAAAAAAAAAALAASIKGGRNGVSHGHDDLGSFVLVAGRTPVLLDPGGEVYTARTFSADRFKSKLLNSYGHNVPVVAGQLQRSTSAARVRVLRTDFTDAADTLAMDLTSAYAVPELKQLRRTFTYDRRGGGSLTVADEADFSSPQEFGITFITFGRWKQTSPTQLTVWQGDQAVRIDLDAAGQTLRVSAHGIDEDTYDKRRPTHVQVDLGTATAQARLTSVIRATPAPTD